MRSRSHVRLVRFLRLGRSVAIFDQRDEGLHDCRISRYDYRHVKYCRHGAERAHHISKQIAVHPRARTLSACVHSRSRVCCFRRLCTGAGAGEDVYLTSEREPTRKAWHEGSEGPAHLWQGRVCTQCHSAHEQEGVVPLGGEGKGERDVGWGGKDDSKDTRNLEGAMHLTSHFTTVEGLRGLKLHGEERKRW